MITYAWELLDPSPGQPPAASTMHWRAPRRWRCHCCCCRHRHYRVPYLSACQYCRLPPARLATRPPQVRALAAAADLPNKGRKDSQGICFLGKVKFSEFVRWVLRRGGASWQTPCMWMRRLLSQKMASFAR